MPIFKLIKNILKPKKTPIQARLPKSFFSKMINKPKTSPKPSVSRPRTAGSAPNKNSPMGLLMDKFLNKFKHTLKTQLQDEFMGNQVKRNTPEEEMNFEESTSFLPTLSRALKKSMPTFIEGLFDLFAGLVNSLLGMFKVKDETKKMVTDAIKPLGEALFSTEEGHTPGKALAKMATAAQPTLVKMLTDFLGVTIPAGAVSAGFPEPKPAYTPRANAPVLKRSKSFSNLLDQPNQPNQPNQLQQ